MSEMELADRHRSCPSHCCRNHGCKYGMEDCPVATGVLSQEYLCELCTWALEEREIFVLNVAADNFMVAYARRDGTVEDLPSAEAVTEAVRSALLGLEVAPGWHVTMVED